MNKSENWVGYLDNIILFAGALVPVGIVIGNVGFEILVAITGLAWLVRAGIVRENPFLRIAGNPAVAAWAAWVLCIILSLVINGSGSKGIMHDIVFIRFFFFGCALLELSTRRQTGKYLAWGLVAGIWFAAFNILAAYFFGYDLLGHPFARYTSKLKEASRFAGMCSFAFPFCIMWALNTKLKKQTRTWKILAVTGVIAMIIVIQTTIRTAFLASFCGMFAGLFFWRVKKMRWIEFFLWLVAVCLAAWFIVELFKGWSLTSFYSRVGIWKVTFAMWKENWVFGVGISSFQDAYARFAASGNVLPYVASTGKTYLALKQTHAHNIFLMLLSATGILGLVSFMSLFACGVVSIVKNKTPWRYGLFACIVVFFISGLTGWNIYHSWYQALFSFLIILSLIGKEEQDVGNI